jgi:flagellar basal body-associated protein FliL
MSAEENESHGGGGSGGGAAGGTSKLVVIASLVNMIATVGIVVVLFLSFQKEKSRTSVEDIVAGQAKGAKSGHGGGGGHGDTAKAEGHGGGGEHGGGHGEAGGHGDGGHGGGHGGGSGGAEVADAGKMVSLEPFTVNLSSGAGANPRYVRMNVSVELEQGTPDKEFEVKTPRVRDTIINLLNSKRANDLAAPEGREQLKEEIKRSVNGYMTQSKVKGVYFTNFAISNP